MIFKMWSILSSENVPKMLQAYSECTLAILVLNKSCQLQEFRFSNFKAKFQKKKSFKSTEKKPKNPKKNTKTIGKCWY